jgi:hypothetical protein
MASYSLGVAFSRRVEHVGAALSVTAGLFPYRSSARFGSLVGTCSETTPRQRHGPRRSNRRRIHGLLRPGRPRRGDHLSHDDSNRLTGYQLRIAPPPTPEWERAHHEKLAAQASDSVAAYAAGRRVALRDASRSRSRRPVPRKRVHDRGRSRRHVRRTVRLVAHGPPGRPRPASGDDEPPSPDVAPRAVAA